MEDLITPITRAYAAKRAIISRIRSHVQAQTEGVLFGVPVDYAYSAATSQMVYIYGGGIVFEQPAEEEIENGRNRLVEETATIGLHVKAKISPPPDGSDGGYIGSEATDAIVEAIGEQLVALLLGTRELIPGVVTITRVAGGRGDYRPTPDGPESTLSIQIDVISNIQRSMIWR